MHLLILGYSSIVHRRVLPAARSLAAVESIAIASRRARVAVPSAPPLDRARADIRWFSNYDEALASSGADAVYVSGINSEHAAWVSKALDRDMHVMVDKPAFLTLDAAASAVDVARRRGRGLAEATVFTFHPQAAALQSLVAAAELPSTRATAVLSIPPRPAGDFRNRADTGGGSLYDLGPYAAATNRLVFGAAPATVDCRVLTNDGVDTSFSVLMTHTSGGALAGHFGFVTTYQNRMSVLTASRQIDVERFFTTPPDMEATLRVREDDRDHPVTTPASDAFGQFIQAFDAAIKANDFDRFTSALLDDATLMARMRKAAAA